MTQVKIKRRYPVHSVFVIYTFVTVLVAVGAFNANNNLLYWLFGLSLGLLLVSGLVSGTMMMALRVTREAIEPGTAGQPLRIRYTVSNSSRFMPVMAVSIIEQIETDHAPGEHHAAIHGRAAGAIRAEILHVPASSTVTVEAVIRPSSRGLLKLRGYDAVTCFPFGIIKKTLWHEAPTSVIIQPASAPIDPVAVERRGGRSSTGDAGRVVSRQGTEHVGLREYAPGDPVKLVAWKASASLGAGELLVKQATTGMPKKLWVRVLLRKDERDDVIELSISRAAAFLRAGLQKRMRVGLSITTDWGPTLDAPPGAHGGRAAALINELALLPTAAEKRQATHAPAGLLARSGVADVTIDVDAAGWRVVGEHALPQKLRATLDLAAASASPGARS